jgi:uncharacterized protein
MAKRFAFILVVFVALTFSAAAQIKSADPAKIDDIRKLMKMTGMENLQQSMIEQMIGSLKQSLPPAPDQDGRFQKMSDRLVDILNEEFKKMSFTNYIIELYDKYFTPDEIKGIIQFYESPVGKKATQVMPALTQDSMSHGMELSRVAGQKAMERWLDEFPELKKAAAPPQVH